MTETLTICLAAPISIGIGFVLSRLALAGLFATLSAVEPAARPMPKLRVIHSRTPRPGKLLVLPGRAS
jgi:hypothetical protein